MRWVTEQIQFWIEAVGKEKLGEGIRIGEERGIRIEANAENAGRYDPDNASGRT